MINLKKYLQNNEFSLGAWVSLGHTSIAEIMAKAGFDWLVVDMEHSSLTLSQVQQLIQVIQLCQVVPLVRVGENNPLIIKRVMDAGAYGVLVPMVNTKEDAIRAVNAVKYPPIGTRGVGLARAQGYGLEFEKYKKWVNKESIVIVQIEHIDAVNNLDDILDIDGIDAFIVGPYDLSASIGIPGEFNDARFRQAIKRIKETAKRHTVTAGFHVVAPDAAQVELKRKEGYAFIGFSLDVLLLGIMCKENISMIRDGVKRCCD